ncbi:hypothetical protein OOK13_41535 [Streptomyces sp. NBC_00378]|nr:MULTISPECIES: hypothetical protein [unclassified Streptomyces]MCX5114823.1 hypothetical protein [Streptomyces sp. NBC_00378]
MSLRVSSSTLAVDAAGQMQHPAVLEREGAGEPQGQALSAG